MHLSFYAHVSNGMNNLQGRILVHYKATDGEGDPEEETRRCSKERMTRWVIGGFIWGLLGTVLCGASKNNGTIPLNKNMWSLSFILVMAGTGSCALTLLYYMVDIQKWWLGAPFNYLGVNSIVIYLGHQLLNQFFPFSMRTPETHAWHLFSNLLGVSMWLLIAWGMYKKGVFINI